MKYIKTLAAAVCAVACAVSLSAAADAPDTARANGKLNILCVSAHPDDVELNVGGTHLKYKKAGHSNFNAFTTS